jgi:hypothetical protein
MAQINQADDDGVPEVLTRFRDAVGVGRIGGPKAERGREDLYWWVASSRGDVRQAGQRIGPWLSSGKRGQFQSAVAITFDLAPVTSLAWAAGLFDAEGSVSLSDHRSHADYEVIEASQTHPGEISDQDHRSAAVASTRAPGLGIAQDPLRARTRLRDRPDPPVREPRNRSATPRVEAVSGMYARAGTHATTGK